jgi:hypothetical protein
MFSESLYGIAGGFVGRTVRSEGVSFSKDQTWRLSVFFGSLAVFLTFCYDVITNIVWGYLSGLSILYAVVVGFVPFGVLHVFSNAVFFGVGCVPAVSAVMKVVGGDGFGVSKK